MKFGILNDILGSVETVPHIKLPKAFSTGESSMVTFHDGAVRRLKGRGLEFTTTAGVLVQVTDANPIIHWHYHTDVDGVDYVFAYTKTHIYKWDDSGKAWDEMFSGSVCTHWSSASFGSKIISTNNMDLVQVWDDTTPGTAFVALDDTTNGIDIDGSNYLTKAGYVIVYESYVVLLDTYEDGVRYKYRRRWCSRGVQTDWDTTGSGDAGYNDLEASLRITGAGIYSAGSASLLITFTNKTHNAMALVEDEIVFQTDNVLEAVGCVAPDSIVNDTEGNLYYLATNWTIRRVFDERSFSAAMDKTFKGISKTLYTGIRSAFVDTLNQICWAIPKDAASTANDKVVRLNLDTMGWEPDVDISVSSFGQYARQSGVYIDDVDVIIDEYDVLIDSIENTEGWVYTVVGDYSGYGYSLATSVTDKGNAYTGYLVLETDLSDGQALSEFKRTHGAWFWFEAEAVSTYKADIEIRGEGQAAFESVGSVNLYGDRKLLETWLPFDVRFKAAEIRISGPNPFAFCGMIFDFSPDGDR